MDSDGKFWATLAAIVFGFASILTACITFHESYITSTALKSGYIQVQNHGSTGYHWEKGAK